MNSPVAKIKEALSIEEVISSYIKLERAGSNLKARCPFHNEKSPSFFVSPDRGSYYCFGCGAKGDIFTFVEEFEGLDFKGALKLLAERAGVSLETYSPKEGDLVFSEKEKLYKAMEESTKFFEKNLSAHTSALEYLKARGLTDETIKNFRIGFAINDWRTLYDYLKSKKFSDKEIELAGLAKHPEDKTKGMYDRFRGRIMFPISDSSGRVIAFSGRILEDDGKSAKYLNSPDTPIFSKSAVLYGLDKAKDSIRRNNFSILVEGQMDLVLSHQAGFKNTVASSGTALSDSTVSKDNAVSNLGIVRRLSSNIVLGFDADKAGLNASDRAGKIALSLGMDVKAVAMPEGVDPADLILKNGADSWREAIKKSKHIIEFILDKAMENAKGDARKSGLQIKEKVLPYVSILDSSIEKSHFLKKISDISGIPENALQEDLEKIEQESKKEISGIKEVTRDESKIFRKDYIERRLVGIALWQKNSKNPIIDFENIIHTLGGIPEKYGLSKEDLIFEAEVFYTDSKNLKKDVDEMLFNFEEEKINEALERKMQELRLIKNKEDEINILTEINDLNKKKETIKNNRSKK